MKKEKDIKKAELSKTEKVSQNTEKFFQRNWKSIVTLSIVIVVLVLVVAAVSFFSNSKSEKLFERSGKLEEDFNALYRITDQESQEYKDHLSKFLADCDSLIADGKKGYTGLKAEYLKGLVLYSEKNYSDAETAFANVAANANGSYLAPLALIGEACAAEDGGNQDKALECYNKVWDDFGKDCPESPKALFNIGRIYEEKGDNELAKATYQQLVDQYGTLSEYSRMASSRVVIL